MLKQLRKAIFISLFFIGFSALLAEPASPATGINGLRFKTGPMRIVRKVDSEHYQIEVSGFYGRRNWTLFLGEELIERRGKGVFSTYAMIETEDPKLIFTARGPGGEKEFQALKLSLNRMISSAEEQDDARRERALSREGSNRTMNFGLGTTFISYIQTDLDPISQTNITSRLDLSYPIVPNRFLWEASGYLSLLSFPSSSIAEEGMKLLGGDLRAGAMVPFAGGAWTVFLYGGLYAMATFGTDNIGYGGVMGPEVYPMVRRRFSNGSSASFYVKVSPILSGFSLLSLDNAHISSGITYYFKPFVSGIFKGFPMGVNVEVSRLRLNVPRGNIITTNYTVGVNMLF